MLKPIIYALLLIIIIISLPALGKELSDESDLFIVQRGIKVTEEMLTASKTLREKGASNIQCDVFHCWEIENNSNFITLDLEEK